MENIFDVKKNQNLNYILPKKCITDKMELYAHEVVLLVHLYYIDKIAEHINYIKNVPDNIDVIFTVSSVEMESILRERLKDLKNNYKIIHKENRGRDISALLVAAKKEVLQYQFIGFIHDKKEKNELLKKDTDDWNYSIWENMIGSKEYIYNVIIVMKENNHIGVLVPPVPITSHTDYGYMNQWGSNFENVKRLANNLSIKCCLEQNKPPIALGTVFWAKRTAIEKLLKHKWNYMDFNSEPLEDDGTISHAIERVIPYVAQDAELYTGWVMTDEYAAKRMENQYHIIMQTYNMLKVRYNICLISEIEEFQNYENELFEFCKQFSEIYIYGIGNNARECFEELLNINIHPRGFLVSEIHGKKQFMGISVQTFYSAISNLSCSHVGIIIAVQERYQKEILEYIILAQIDRRKVYIRKCSVY